MKIINLLKGIISVLPQGIHRDLYLYKNRLIRKSVIKKWISTGRPLPPPHQYKQSVVEEISKKFMLNVFVETGTFMGHMIEAQRMNFAELFSIEVEPTLYKNAVKYFQSYRHIKIVEGDSSFVLNEILSEVHNNSTLFWLDGHYSGGNTGMGKKQCPIYEELHAIFNHNISTKCILIDDARCFNGTEDYPTIEELINFVEKNTSSLKVNILNDIIHIY